MKKLIFSSEKHQATLLSYCAAMKIISEAKLSIYHKFLMAQRITTHLRLLRQLKFLTASKFVFGQIFSLSFEQTNSDRIEI